MRDKPAAIERITASSRAAGAVLWPKIGLLPDYPDVKVELVADNGFVDMVGDRLDAGVSVISWCEYGAAFAALGAESNP